MPNSFKSIIGLKIEEFEELINNSENKGIQATQARLIPASKRKNDEMALTSVFLSSLVLIKEFRELFFKEVNFSRGGKLLAYTEVTFPNLKRYKEVLKKDRIDGMVVAVAGGKIKDAVLFEMKCGSNEIQKEQIESYIKVAQELKIDKFISVSNQYVTSPKFYPIKISIPKKFNLYHFSWHYILMLANILLFDNEINISDPTQISIMHEVICYLEHPDSGVKDFNRMSKGWEKTVTNLRRGTFTKSDLCFEEAVNDWIEEERDIAFKLTNNLGVFVQNKFKKYKNLQERIDLEKNNLIKNFSLESEFKIPGAVSNLKVIALFKDRSIQLEINVKVPSDKKQQSAKLNWVKRQLDNQCKKKNPNKFELLKSDIAFRVNTKGKKENLTEVYSNYDKLLDDVKESEIKDVDIVLYRGFGKDFTASEKFIKNLESLILDFYIVIVQNLKNWEKPAPKVKGEALDNTEEDLGEDESEE